ncbi:MAG: transporter, partial [Pseudomonadota bacterium]
DEAFRAFAQDGLKTFRKQNALLLLATQSPADVLRSPIAHTLVEQCATQIFLPNPLAQARDYVDGFGLTERELTLVRDELPPRSGKFLIKQAGLATVAELDLAGLEDDLAVLSGRASSVALMRQLREAIGSRPDDWLATFQQNWRSLP